MVSFISLHTIGTISIGTTVFGRSAFGWRSASSAAKRVASGETPLEVVTLSSHAHTLAPEVHPANPLPSPKPPIPNVRKMAGNGRRRRHHRTHQMRPPTASLPSFKVSIAGGSAAFARLQNIRIHS